MKPIIRKAEIDAAIHIYRSVHLRTLVHEYTFNFRDDEIRTLLNPTSLCLGIHQRHHAFKGLQQELGSILSKIATDIQKYPRRFRSFEDIYNRVCTDCNDVKGCGTLTYYDLSCRIAWCLYFHRKRSTNKINLFPSEYIYLNCGAFDGAEYIYSRKALIECAKEKGKYIAKSKCAIIPTNEINGDFMGLTPFLIENFFCECFSNDRKREQNILLYKSIIKISKQ